jgi:hypothetical protein
MTPTVRARLTRRDALVACPYCGGEHAHAQVAGERESLCGRGSYRIELPAPPSTTYALTLEGDPEVSLRALRWMLKVALRRYGLAAVAVVPIVGSVGTVPAPGGEP